jgi:hypothetical protein
LQEEYKEFKESETDLSLPCPFNASEEERKRVAFDKAMMCRVKGKGKGLAGFVKRRVSTEKAVADVLPKQKNVDLKDPVLRTKGVVTSVPIPTEPIPTEPIPTEHGVVPENKPSDQETKKTKKKPGKKKNIVTIYEA